MSGNFKVWEIQKTMDVESGPDFDLVVLNFFERTPREPIIRKSDYARVSWCRGD